MHQYDRSGEGLTAVPTDIPWDAETVILSSNLITEVPAGSFSHLRNCESLRLDHNKISVLERDAFDGLEVYSLDLSFNLLSNISENAFRGLSVNHLEMDSNKFTILTHEMFQGLEVQSSLSLGNNQIHTISEGAFQGVKGIGDLHLYISNNKLQNLHSGMFLDLELRLSYLEVSGNQIDKLEYRSLSSLGTLESLNLARNKLATLEPGALSGLGRLRTLDLDGNQIATLHEEVFSGLIRLRWLLLDGNPLVCNSSLCW